MFAFYPVLQKKYTGMFGVFGKFLHIRLGMSPLAVSCLGFLCALIAAFFIFRLQFAVGLFFLAASLIFDATDGSIARMYGLASKSGALIDMIFDRVGEFVLLLVLLKAGLISITLAAITYFVTLAATASAHYTGIDFGMRRTALFFGPFLGFTISLYLTIAAGVCALSVSTVKLLLNFSKSSSLRMRG